MRKELAYSSQMYELKIVRNNELNQWIMDGKVHVYSDRQLKNIAETITAYLDDKEKESKKKTV